eukprot:944927-Pelagomonas_calceolata.AAC.2
MDTDRAGKSLQASFTRIDWCIRRLCGQELLPGEVQDGGPGVKSCRLARCRDSSELQDVYPCTVPSIEVESIHKERCLLFIAHACITLHFELHLYKQVVGNAWCCVISVCELKAS